MFFNVWYTEKIYFALNAVLQTPSWHSFTGVSPIFLLSIGVATLVMLIHLRKTGTISNLQAVTSRVPTADLEKSPTPVLNNNHILQRPNNM